MVAKVIVSCIFMLLAAIASYGYRVNVKNKMYKQASAFAVFGSMMIVLAVLAWLLPGGY
jgi:Mg2+ and Co2+ transporter CorA